MIRWLSTPDSDIPQLLVAHVSIIPGRFPKRFKNIFWILRRKTSESLPLPNSPKWNAAIEQFAVVYRGRAEVAALEPGGNLSVNISQGFKTILFLTKKLTFSVEQNPS
jgi:hypothetical protein